VFQALIDPAVTTRFWFTHSTGKLESGKHVRWYWEMYDHAADVEVEAIEDHERISMTWPAYEGDSRTTIEWTFRPLSEDTTFVSVKNGGFVGDPSSVVKQAIDAAEGFSFVLAGMKALLEHGIELDLVRDRFPPGIEHS
jgi:uncharacterized protein YndB with AHSA1/START domain